MKVVLTEDERRVLAMVRGVPRGGRLRVAATDNDLAAMRSLIRRELLRVIEEEGKSTTVVVTLAGDNAWF